MGYSSWGRKELDTTDRVARTSEPRLGKALHHVTQCALGRMEAGFGFPVALVQRLDKWPRWTVRFFHLFLERLPIRERGSGLVKAQQDTLKGAFKRCVASEPPREGQGLPSHINPSPVISPGNSPE